MLGLPGSSTGSRAARIRERINQHVGLGANASAPGQEDLNQLLKDAYEHWFAQEESPPSGGGATPESPRAKILSARFRISMPQADELLLFVTDGRSDVVEVAKPILMQELSINSEIRSVFLQGIALGNQSPHLLARAIESRVPFTAEQCRVICELLKHSTPQVRYAALKILDPAYISREQISSWLEVLANDPEEQIRDRVTFLRTPALAVS